MWVLESSGHDLKGKKLWLRPGKRVTFGRTNNNEIGEHIILSHKTISRKHLTVEVDQSSADDCCKIQSRSKVIIKDFNTKIGSLLNDEQIRGRSVELVKEKNNLALGRYEQIFCINWIPVTLTFSFTTKEHKANPYPKLYQQFGPLDIKILVDYQNEHTTHVVARKRNTSKSLQALIDGKHIVHNDSFVNALLASCLSRDNSHAPLEVDFDGNLPIPIQYLPPKGNEPTNRDEMLYAPNKSRQHIFSNYSFVFYEERQYENLMPPITAGSGRAILQVVRPYETTVEDFVRFCENISNEVGIGNSMNTNEIKDIIVVRYNPAKGVDSEWYSEFGKKLALGLNRQLVEQNEFLDAILANDASILKHPLCIKNEEHTVFHVSPTALDTSLNVLPSVVKQTQPSSPLRPTRTRRTTRLKFTGFDDEFTESFNKSPNHIHQKDIEIIRPSSPGLSICHSQGLFVSQDANNVSKEPEIQQQQSPFDEESSEKRFNFTNINITQEHEPSVHVMKRKRPHEDMKFVDVPSPKSNINSNIKNNQTASECSKPSPFRLASKKKRKDVMDVEEILLQKLEKNKADLKNKADCESLHEQFGELDFCEIRNKIQVEEIKPRNPIRTNKMVRAEDSSRWNDLWNGRKNFKKFRRQGFGKKVLEKVIVQLKEVKTRDYEAFEDYWGTGGDERRSSKSAIKERTVKDISQNKQSPASDKSLLGSLEIYPDFETSTEIDSSARTPNNSKFSSLRSDPQHPRESHTMRQSQISVYMSKDDKYSSSNSFKRAASSISSRSIPAKKPKFASNSLRVESDEESADELKFRFKKN